MRQVTPKSGLCEQTYEMNSKLQIEKKERKENLNPSIPAAGSIPSSSAEEVKMLSLFPSNKFLLKKRKTLDTRSIKNNNKKKHNKISVKS